MLQLLSSDPLAFVVVAVCLVFSLTLHEWGHAYAADRLGDSTPRLYGRVTLNPLKHLDPIGALLLIVVGFGFARPVPVNFARVGRWGSLIVAAAGPVMNILTALVVALLLRFVPLLGSVSLGQLSLADVLSFVLSINIVLAVFNLIPIPLLDGSRIVAALFPRTLGRSLMEFERQPYAFLIVLLFIFLARDPIFSFVSRVESAVQGLVNAI